MASCSDERKTYKVLSPYQVLVSQIGTELDSFNVKVIKTALYESSILTEAELNKIDTRERGSGVDLISKLQIYRYIAPNNLDLLKDLLAVSKSFQLLEKVVKFAETVTELYDTTIGQMDRLPERMALYLVLSGRKELLSQKQIDVLKQEICKCINVKGLTIGHLPYISSRENDKNTTIARFQFPEHFPYEEISERLKSSAMKKEPWLRENGVITLKVNGESSINIEENVEFNPPRNEDEFVLAKKPHLEIHDRNVVDVILVVDMPMSVTSNACKAMLKECQSAVDVLKQSETQIDINVAVIRFGNHSSSKQSTALIQDFCKDFDVYSKLKEKGRCGERDGNSGMADALAKVVELAEGDKIRQKASKVCIMITFMPKTDKKLDHYKCNHGNDIIKLTNTLAEHEMPLYILGIHGNTQRTMEDLYFEGCLLAGVCHIGGGRYFRISKNEITEMISGVVKNDISIENHSEITGEVVKHVLNNHHGDINDRQLANDVAKDPLIKPLHFEKLLQNGQSLEPISQVAERVDLANDLNDAIEAITRMHIRKDDHGESSSRCAYLQQRYPGIKVAQISYEFDPEMYCEEDVNADVMKSSHECPDTSTLEESKEIIDLEMASRIVKRHLHRMAYYKKKH